LKKRKIQLDFLPYAEYNHLWTNHLIKTDSTRTGEKLDFQIINPQLGLNIKVGKSFIFDIGYRLLFQYNSHENKLGFSRIAPKVGLEYIIHTKGKSLK
jgi:hypothetical protein